KFVDKAGRIRGVQPQPITLCIAAPVPVGVVVLAPGAAVAFVGGDDVGGVADGVGGDAVGHVQALDARPGADVDCAIGVAGVQAVAFDAMVFGAQRQDVGDAGVGDVEFRQ